MVWLLQARLGLARAWGVAVRLPAAVAKVHHPDLAPNSSVGSAASADVRFQAVREAFDVLSDPERRALYDRGVPLSPTTAAAARIDRDAVMRRALKFEAQYMRGAGSATAAAAAEAAATPSWLRFALWATKPRLGLLVPAFAAVSWYLACGGDGPAPVYSSDGKHKREPPG